MSPTATRAGLALVLLATFAVYAQTLRFPFVTYDDPEYVYANETVRGGLSAASIRWAVTTGEVSNWHPVTWLSHLLDVTLFGVERPGLHHATSVLLHLANTVLLFGLLRSMTGAEGPSLLAAGLFALHPLHVESVAWVAERKDVLSTLFFLLTLWAYARGRRAMSLACFALGLMSKPMLVTVPGVLLLLDYWPLNRLSRENWRARVMEKWPYLAMAVASAVVTLLVQQEALRSFERVGVATRVGNAAVAYAMYLFDTIWPSGLAVFYPYPKHLSALQVTVALVVLIAITVIAVRQRGHRPYLLVGWLWFLVTLTPVIGFVQVGDQARADRYTYIPLIGIFVAVAWLLAEALERHRPAFAAAAAASLVAFASITARQVTQWRSSEALFTRAATVTRDNWLAWNHLATLYAHSNRAGDAFDAANRAIAARPEYATGYYNLGNLHLRGGDLDSAERAYADAIARRPDFAAAHNNRGIVAARRGDPAVAAEHFERAVRLQPRVREWQDNLARARHRAADAVTTAPATSPSP